MAGTRQVQQSKTMTLSRRETTGYNENISSDCFGNEDTLPTAVSTFMLMQNWSISHKCPLAGTPADVSPTTIQGYQGSHKTLPCVVTEVLCDTLERDCLPPHFSWIVSITTDSWQPHQSCALLVHEVLLKAFIGQMRNTSWNLISFVMAGSQVH